jgi:flavin reductase (DIM6/NTAB) family NADH-FMN oxidoreductase RutF
MDDAGVGIQVESGIDGDLYRKVLGRYPTGVTLVTGMGDGEPLAMVIGSFR